MLIRFWLTFSACLVFVLLPLVLLFDLPQILGLLGEDAALAAAPWAWLVWGYAVFLSAAIARMPFLTGKIPGHLGRAADMVVACYPAFLAFNGVLEAGIGPAAERLDVLSGYVMFFLIAFVIALLMRLHAHYAEKERLPRPAAIALRFWKIFCGCFAFLMLPFALAVFWDFFAEGEMDTYHVMEFPLLPLIVIAAVFAAVAISPLLMGKISRRWAGLAGWVASFPPLLFAFFLVSLDTSAEHASDAWGVTVLFTASFVIALPIFLYSIRRDVP